jgi:hypothetical protein
MRDYRRKLAGAGFADVWSSWDAGADLERIRVGRRAVRLLLTRNVVNDKESMSIDAAPQSATRAQHTRETVQKVWRHCCSVYDDERLRGER